MGLEWRPARTSPLHLTEHLFGPRAQTLFILLNHEQIETAESVRELRNFFRDTGSLESKSENNGVECSGTLLESGGDDLHHILKHLCQSGQELSQGALQDRRSQT